MVAYSPPLCSLCQYFSFSGEFDWKGKKPFYDFSYLNDQLYQQINLMLSDNSNAYLWSGNSEIYWQREQSGGLYATIYKNSVVLDYDSQSLTFGFENISLSDISSTDSFPVKPTEGVLNGLFLGYKYSSLRTTRKGVYPEEGFSVSAWTKLYSKAFASNFDLNKYKFSFSKYFCSPYPHNVLGVLGSLSLNYGDTFTKSGFDYDPVFIRGYPYSSVYGSKIAYTGIKYGFPLFYPEVGMGYGYLFFDRVWGEFFYEGVEADLKNNYQGLLKRWYGAQVNFGTINGWEMLPVNISLAYAKGIDVDGENKVYLNFALY